MSWPAVHTMFAHWVPPHERSKFVTSYHGSAIGIAIFYPLFGYIVSVLSWEWPYYICGIIGTTWFACWQYLAYDTPELHPRIDTVEKEFIELSLGDSCLQEEAVSCARNAYSSLDINSLGMFSYPFLGEPL